ncbi:ESX secretion-associated protein EspG [Mycolicibacterium litorale]|nr:ESX secretion-associated protein EspG [Mycolicibacterium litorale]
MTVGAAWLVAETVGAGWFPWVLAITPPLSQPSDAALIRAGLRVELIDAGVMTADDVVHPAVVRWIRTVCTAEQWLELRYVRGADSDLLRGIVARWAGRTVVALRSGQLVTFTELDITDPHLLAEVVIAGLPGRTPARFAEFVLPTRVGARADERLRNGAGLDGVLDHLGIPGSAAAVVRSAISGSRSYVEARAGANRSGVQELSEVGVGIVDSEAGRVLVSPQRATDGEWLSTFTPGTPFAIALALTRLTATLTDGGWFPATELVRDFAGNRT